MKVSPTPCGKVASVEHDSTFGPLFLQPFVFDWLRKDPPFSLLFMGSRFRHVAPLPFFNILVIFIVSNDVDPYLAFYNGRCQLQCLNEGK
jgi:hypothetical protein